MPAVNEERGGWGEMDDDLILICEEVKLDQSKQEKQKEETVEET